MLSPETFPIIEGHEAIAASALVDTAAAVCLKDAKGVLIVFHHATGSDVDVTLTVHEGATKAEAEAGTYPITTGAEFPIWVTLACGSSDVPVRQADAISYKLDTGNLTGHSIVFFYIPAAKLTNNRKWVHLGSDTGGTGLCSVLYILDGERYQQATPPTAIA